MPESKMLRRRPSQGQRVYVLPERQHGIVQASVNADRTYTKVRLEDGREVVLEGLAEMERARWSA